MEARLLVALSESAASQGVGWQEKWDNLTAVFLVSRDPPPHTHAHAQTPPPSPTEIGVTVFYCQQEVKGVKLKHRGRLVKRKKRTTRLGKKKERKVDVTWSS